MPNPQDEEQLIKRESIESNLQILDNLPFAKWHKFIIVCLGITWLFDGFEVSLMSIFNQQIRDSFKINQAFIGFTNSLYLVGAIFGSVSFGLMSTLYGRKKLF